MQNSAYVEVRSADDMRVPGTRVGLEHLLEAYRTGLLPEEIAVEFPTVSLEQVHGVIALYLANREEVDAYLNRCRNRAKEARHRQATGEQAEVIRRLRQLAAQQVKG